MRPMRLSDVWKGKERKGKERKGGRRAPGLCVRGRGGATTASLFVNMRAERHSPGHVLPLRPVRLLQPQFGENPHKSHDGHYSTYDVDD